MTFDTHPRQIQRYRDVKPAIAGVPNFRCRKCGHQIFQFAGRKKCPGGGFKCAQCVSASAAF
jgi:rubrerythrin